MTKFKIGDKVRIKKVLRAINHETNEPFKKNDIAIVTGIIDARRVRVGHGIDNQDVVNRALVDDLELVEDEKKVYTKDDIYEGMVLECVYTTTNWWTEGKQYVVDKELHIHDDDDDYGFVGEIVNLLNNDYFKVVDGGRNIWLAGIIGKLFATGLEHDEVRTWALYANQIGANPPLEEDEVIQTYNSIRKREIRRSVD